MNWIKCSERRPPEAGHYLAAFEDGHVAEDEYYGPQPDQWWKESHADHGSVTHWMPLPASPNATEGSK